MLFWEFILSIDLLYLLFNYFFNFVRFNYDANTKLSDKKFATQQIFSAAYIKILINYLQTISIIKSLRLNWQQVWSQFFVFQEVASGGIGRALNLECIIEGIANYTLILYKLYFRFEFSHLL